MPVVQRAWTALGPIAIAAPVLVAFNQPPSPTFYNQATALLGWGALLLASCFALRGERRAPRGGLDALLAAFAALVIAAAAAPSWAGQPLTLSRSAIALLLAAAFAAQVGAALQTAVLRQQACAALATGLLVAGAASVAIGLIQVFAPQWPDGEWIARSGIPGRAVGNLRQPNHLATLLLWSVVAVIPLIESRHDAVRRAWPWMAGSLFALLLFGVVLSGSRTGLVGLVVLVGWGLFDHRLSRLSRGLLIASPLICAASWWLLDLLAAAQGTGAHLGAATRVGESDPSGGRFAIWRDTLALIAQNPWWGVGFGEFNFAWSLTPFPHRHHAFFDHTHNLPLQLMVELGIPLALLVLGLLGWGLWQAFDRTRRVEGFEGSALRAALVMVLLMALHSQLEYPLWYAYFLLPTAFAWGLCLGAGEQAPVNQADGNRRARWPVAAGVALMVGAVLMLVDYRRVVVIFAPGEGAAPLAERIADGRHSWFFGHHADYALVTTPDEPVTEPGAFDRATHYLLDTRLMIAWARSLDAQGDRDRARHLAARLREFRNPASAEFFAPCGDAAVDEKSFQCEPPSKAMDWRDFRPAR